MKIDSKKDLSIYLKGHDVSLKECLDYIDVIAFYAGHHLAQDNNLKARLSHIVGMCRGMKSNL